MLTRKIDASPAELEAFRQKVIDEAVQPLIEKVVTRQVSTREIALNPRGYAEDLADGALITTEDCDRYLWASHFAHNLTTEALAAWHFGTDAERDSELATQVLTDDILERLYMIFDL